MICQFGADTDLNANIQGLSFKNKLEVIQMHLDILYKSINFLSKDRIKAKLDEYKKVKELKRKEEEERI